MTVADAIPCGAEGDGPLIVCDLEATCWRLEDDPELASEQRAASEVIEIGAVRLDPQSFEIIDTFSEFVRPERHPVLSDFCRGLTHIGQDEVAAAEPFAVVWPRFAAWVGGPLEAVTFASWGAYDFAQLRRQVRALEAPPPAWRPLNIKAAFADWHRLHGPNHRFGLGAALAVLGWTFEGSPHRALVDARNAARVLAHLAAPAHLGDAAWRVLFALEPHERLGLERLRVQHPLLRLSLGRTRKALLQRGLVEVPEAGFLGLTAAGRRAVAGCAGAPGTRSLPPAPQLAPPPATTPVQALATFAIVRST